jgi:hypothetical protein
MIDRKRSSWSEPGERFDRDIEEDAARYEKDMATDEKEPATKEG